MLYPEHNQVQVPCNVNVRGVQHFNLEQHLNSHGHSTPGSIVALLSFTTNC